MPVRTAFIARLFSTSIAAGLLLCGCNVQIGPAPGSASGTGASGSPAGVGGSAAGGSGAGTGVGASGGSGTGTGATAGTRRGRRGHGDTARSERRRAAAATPADVARVPQHGARPAQRHDVGRPGRRPGRGGRHQQQRVPVSPADVDQHGGLEQSSTRRRGARRRPSPHDCPRSCPARRRTHPPKPVAPASSSRRSVSRRSGGR